jgi:hypothetical protein
MKDRLIIIDANDTKNFKYTDFDSGRDASFYPIGFQDRLAWVVRASGNFVPYRIDFNKNGSPFGTASIVVPQGGLSPQQLLAPDAQIRGFGYTVTVSGRGQDDPQVEPYDNLEVLQVLRIDPPPAVTITVTVNGAIAIDTPGPYAPLSLICWKGDPTLRVDFSGSGQNPVSPFIDATGNQSPLPFYPNGTTVGQQIRANASGKSYQYSISAGGKNSNFTFTVR